MEVRKSALSMMTHTVGGYSSRQEFLTLGFGEGFSAEHSAVGFCEVSSFSLELQLVWL